MKNVFTFILLFFSFNISAQKDSLLLSGQRVKNYSFGINYFGGKILIHTPKIYLQTPAYSQAFEFNFNKQTLGDAAWQQRFGFPETGLSVCLAHHGSSQLGVAAGLYPTIQFRIINLKKGYWYWKLGGGIAINTKSWKRTPAADSMNNIVGSTLNNFTMIQTGVRVKLATKWTLQTGVHFYHVSNAGARKPNFGINTMGAHIGVNYHPKGFVNHFEKSTAVTGKRENPLNAGIQSAVSFAEDKTADGPVYANYNLTLFAGKMYRGKNRISLGLEGTYNSKLYSLFKNTYQHIGKERANAWQYAFFVAHEFVFGKIGLPLQLGCYFNKPLGGEPIYEKLGINYHFYHQKNKWVKDMYILAQLKTHYATADFAEFGLGVLF